MAVNELTFANMFKIYSRWKPREESPKELGQRTLRCLDTIAPLHPAFRNWTFLDLFREPMEMTKENIGEFLCPLEKARPRMTDIVVDWGEDQDDYGTREPRGGYSISVTADNGDPSQRVTLSAHGGGLTSWTTLPRHASFETNMCHRADPTIVSYPAFEAVLQAIVSCWDVDHASASCRNLWKLETEPHYFCGLSWMVYLSAQLVRRITVPTGVLVERFPDGGLLMIAAEETFDVANPKHMAGAECILKSLEPLNVEEAERWARSRT